MRKNNYEEALFKIEDEKFEIDSLILLTKSGLKFIESLENEKDVNKRNEVLKKIHRLKILKKTDFVVESSETVDFVKSKLLEKVDFSYKLKKIGGFFLFLSNFSFWNFYSTYNLFSKKLAPRLRNRSIKRSQGLERNSRKKFQQISRSPAVLLQKTRKKSVYTSQCSNFPQKINKTLFFHSDFIKEVEDRKLQMNNPSKTSEFVKPLNTFEGLTLSFSCKKLHCSNNCENFSSEKLSHFLFPPIFTFDFSETMILEDSLSIFWQFLVNSHLTHHEKAHEKVLFFYENFFLFVFQGKNEKKFEIDLYDSFTTSFEIY